MKYLWLLIPIAVLIASCGGKKQVPEMEQKNHVAIEQNNMSAAGEKIIYYTCPMEIHSHIRHDAPGRYEECNMELKPMRLVKASEM